MLLKKIQIIHRKAIIRITSASMNAVRLEVGVFVFNGILLCRLIHYDASITKKVDKMKRFLHIMLSGILAVAVLCCGCGTQGQNGKRNTPVQSMDIAMGTIISQTLYGERAGEGTGEILGLLTDLEQKQLSWRSESSEIFRINEVAGNEEGIPISDSMKDILEKCIEVSEASGGAFDITIGEVVRLWEIDVWAGKEDVTGYSLPEQTTIEEGLKASGYKKVELEENKIYLPLGMQLDMGAVGKGIALDEIRQYLSENLGITGGVISVGGSIVTYGSKPDASPWRVGVVNPMNSAANLGYLELTGEWCVSTSGDYERYVEVGGERYHHIIDPQTGYPADSGVRGVTILSKDGLLSDALSTACFILGAEEGCRLAEGFGAEVLFVKADGEIVMTDGMKQYFHLSK